MSQTRFRRIVSIVFNNRKAPVVAVFSVFLATRLFVILNSTFPMLAVGIYGDAYAYYVPAGIAYVSGSLPDSVNPEHPPLAKYIIGLFAVYMHDARAASLIFGLLTAAIVFLLVKKLTTTIWAPIGSVWLLTFDPVNIGLSIYPMLDIFMIFFAMLSVYLLVSTKKPAQYAFVGVTVGLALACKWSAMFFAIPEVIYLVGLRRITQALGLVGGAALGYVLPYVPLILGRGIPQFVGLQLWMGRFMVNSHGPGGYTSLLSNLVSFIIFHSTTYAPVSGYDPKFHPEAIRFLGHNYISLADMINPLITLAVFPVLYDETKQYLAHRETFRLLLLMIVGGAIIEEVIFPVSLVTWYDAPLIILTCILIADLLFKTEKRSMRGRLLVCLYLTLTAIWLLLATAIVLIRIANYRTLSTASASLFQHQNMLKSIKLHNNVTEGYGARG